MNNNHNATKEDIKEIKKHLSVLNKEMGMVQTDVVWIKKFVFILIPLLFGMIISLIYIIIGK